MIALFSFALVLYFYFVKTNDSNFIWHPFTQEKTSGENICIVKGEGALLWDDKGNEYIDAVSSWWVNLHGHAHPHIAKKIAEQALQLEHVIFAGFTHPKAIELSERLIAYLPDFSKAFFSDDGSTSVEVALKMAIQFNTNNGKKKNKVIALENGYHGDTFGSMSVSGRNVFNRAFEEHLFEVNFISVPGNKYDAEYIKQFEEAVNDGSIAAIIFEPIVQAAAGMVMYDLRILDEMISICRNKNIITIADEVFTGFGRTGKMFAVDHLQNKPDIICLSKGLTGGFMPMGITLCKQFIYDAFYSDDKTKALFHGHSYTGNPLACAAACASLDLFTDETFSKIRSIENSHLQFVGKIKGNKKVKDVRVKGVIIAIEINSENKTGYFNSLREEIYSFFIKKGLVMRPLGNVIYIVPPYCITDEQLKECYNAIEEFLERNG